MISLEDMTTLEQVTVGVYLLLQILDVWTTIKGIKLGATEANPIVKWMMYKLGKMWPLAKLTVALVSGYFLLETDTLWGMWLISAGMVIVVLNNYRVIKNQSKHK